MGDQIGAAVPVPPVSDVPAAPSLTNPLTFTCQSGVPNFFDAAGRDAVVLSSGVVQQGPPNDNAIVTVKNCPNLLIQKLAVNANTRQSPGVGNGYGYGLYLIGCGLVHVEDYTATGPGLAQAVVVSGAKTVRVIRGTLSPMHPVWHVAKGKPAEVHTDGIQSYGGPGVLELYDTSIVTCGTAVQVQPYKGAVSPMGVWKYHRVRVQQVTNPDSDEMPFCLTKDPSGGSRWPSDTVGSSVQPLGTTFGVSWVSDPAAWAPGGAWANTGEAWTVVS